MRGFADIHSHVLYGLDDGAETIDISVEMLERARESGTTDIVATPHANRRYAFRPEVIEDRIAELSARVRGITLHRGCDFHVERGLVDDAIANPAKYTVNHRQYLLVELPDITVVSAAEQTLARLREAGMRPILTHPERNKYLQANPDIVARWVAAGCYVQITAGSFTGDFGRRARNIAETLVARNLVHLVASDAHGIEWRPPDLRQAYETLSRKWGESHVRPLFVDNPHAVVTGDLIDGLATPVRRRRWYQFWK